MYDFTGIITTPPRIRLPIVKVESNNEKYIEYKSGKNEELTIEKYLESIRPYLRDMMDDLKTSAEWKIQMTIKIDFENRLC